MDAFRIGYFVGYQSCISAVIVVYPIIHAVHTLSQVGEGNALLVRPHGGIKARVSLSFHIKADQVSFRSLRGVVPLPHNESLFASQHKELELHNPVIVARHLPFQTWL